METFTCLGGLSAKKSIHNKHIHEKFQSSFIMESKIVCSDPLPPSVPHDEEYDDHMQQHRTFPSPEVIARVEAGNDPMFDENWNQRSWNDYCRYMVPIWRREVLPAFYDRFYKRSRSNPWIEFLAVILESICKQWWFKR